jgi:hypothetical protein
MRPGFPTLLLGLGVLSVARLSAATPEWSISLEERLLGDGNVLRLSDSDVQRLEDDPAFQTDVQGVEALKLEHRATASMDLRLTQRKGVVGSLQRLAGGKPGQGRLRLSWEGKWTQVEESSAMGNHSQRLQLGWQPRTGWGVDVAWRHLENFDLRQFNDRDTGQEHGASFDSDGGTLTLKARGKDRCAWFRQPGLSLSAGTSTEYYNAWFTEYDMESTQLGAELGWRMPLGLDAGLGYTFVSADNVGFAGAQEGQVNLGADSESGDATHEEDQVSVDMGWSGAAALKGLSANAALLLRDRHYQSELGELLDPYHAGRHDRRWTFTLRGKVELGAGLSLSPLLEREWRKSTAAWGGVGRVKDYAILRWGLGLRWQLSSR